MFAQQQLKEAKEKLLKQMHKRSNQRKQILQGGKNKNMSTEHRRNNSAAKDCRNGTTRNHFHDQSEHLFELCSAIGI